VPLSTTTAVAASTPASSAPAPAAEAYDPDICPGHSAMGTYHHSNPTCLADQLGYDWYRSPIYGFAADGVPIAGPWVSDNTLARSSWRIRDYADSGPEP